jgi:SAM-dependent methyltransferase
MPTRDGTGADHEELLLLWCARRTGVLDALTTTAGTPETVADETALDRETSGRIVRAMAAYGYVRRVGDEYEVTNRALGFLATRDVRSIGATPRALDLLDATAELGSGGDGARRGPVAADTGDGDDRRLRHRLGAHAATPRSTVRAGVTAAIHAAPHADRVVDVRGSSGVYAAEFARRGYDVTLVESAAVVDVVGPMLAGRDVDALAAAHPTAVPVADAEVALLAEVVQRRPPATNRTLLRAVHDALAPGGTVVVFEPLRDRSTEARRVAVERLAVGRGDAYSGETIAEWLDDAGFVAREPRDVPGTGRQVVVGRRERGVD